MSGRVARTSLKPFSRSSILGWSPSLKIRYFPAAQLLDDPLAAHPSGLEVIGADKVKPAAGGGIGVNGNDWDSSADGGIDLRRQHRGVRD